MIIQQSCLYNTRCEPQSPQQQRCLSPDPVCQSPDFNCGAGSAGGAFPVSLRHLRAGHGQRHCRFTAFSRGDSGFHHLLAHPCPRYITGAGPGLGNFCAAASGSFCSTAERELALDGGCGGSSGGRSCDSGARGQFEWGNCDVGGAKHPAKPHHLRSWGCKSGHGDAAGGFSDCPDWWGQRYPRLAGAARAVARSAGSAGFYIAGGSRGGAGGGGYSERSIQPDRAAERVAGLAGQAGFGVVFVYHAVCPTHQPA